MPGPLHSLPFLRSLFVLTKAYYNRLLINIYFLPHIAYLNTVFDQSSGISIGLSAIITFNQPSNKPWTSKVSISRTGLPEMRHQIQVEYLAEYLARNVYD